MLTLALFVLRRLVGDDLLPPLQHELQPVASLLLPEDVLHITPRGDVLVVRAVGMYQASEPTYINQRQVESSLTHSETCRGS